MPHKRSHAPKKQVRPRISRIAKNPRGIFARSLLKWGLVIVGVGLLLFPSGYRFWKSGQWRNFGVKVARTESAKPQAGVQKVNASSGEPIKIDGKLLGSAPEVQLPQRVMLPTVGIDLPVVEAPVINGYWELSETSASHGVGSANPGENGNIVVFAHAREGLFMNLRNAKKDDNVYVLSREKWFRYKVTDYKLVDPNQVEVISPTTEETLTLYTCDGFLDAKRLIVVAKPVRT